jgi:hypothetical protein
MTKIWVIPPPPRPAAKKIKSLVEFTLGKKKIPKKLQFSSCKKKDQICRKKIRGKNLTKRVRKKKPKKLNPENNRGKTRLSVFPF